MAGNDAYATDANGNFSASFSLGTTTPVAGGTSSPSSGDALFFGTETTGSLMPTDDLGAVSFAGITFNANASSFTIGGANFTSTGAITNNAANAQTINNAIGFTAQTFNAAAGGLTFAGTLTGTGVLTVTGPKAITLGGTSNSVNGLTIGTSVAANTNTNVAVVGEAGVTLNLSNTQGVGAILVGSGANVVNVGAGAAITSAALGSVGSNDRFTALNINLGAGASMTTSASNNVGGVLVTNQFDAVTLNGTDFASSVSGSIAPATYMASTTASMGAGTASQNTNVVTDVALANGGTVNAIRFADTVGHTITVSAGQTLSLNATSNGAGTVLMSANNGAVTNTITGGTLQGSGNRGYSFLNYDTTNGALLDIESNINNAPSSANGNNSTVNVMVAGGGRVMFGGANFINGAMLVDGSTLAAATDANLGGINGTVSIASAASNSTTVVLSAANTLTSGLVVGDVLLGQVISAISGTPGTGTTVTLAAAYTGTAITSATTVGFVGGGSVNLNGGTLLATGTYTLGETNNTGSSATGLTTTVRNRNVGLGLKGGTFDVTGTSTLTVPGTISGGGPLNKVDSGTMSLTGGNSYTGVTNITGGTLLVGQFGGITASPVITVANGAGFNSAAKGTAGFNVLATQSLINNGTVTGSLTTAGPVVDNGTLTGQVNVNAGGILAGTGSAASAYVTGGTITAGSGASNASSPGKLTTTVAQNWSSGTFVDKVTSTTAGAGIGNDLLVTSSLNITGAFALNVLTSNGSSPSLAPGAVLVLAADMDGSSANPFNASAPAYSTLTSNLTLTVNGAAPVGLSYGTQADTTGNGGFDLVLQATSAAPEPTSLLLAALGAVPLVLGRRHRRA